MRSRRQILEDATRLDIKQLEVLLDIRDLLTKQKKQGKQNASIKRKEGSSEKKAQQAEEEALID